MNVDALTVSAVVDELRRTVLGGRIQHVLLPSPLSIGMEVYRTGRRYQLLASANPRAARLHLLDARLSRGVESDTPLLLLLRKYVRNGILTGIEQPPLERLVVLSITKYPGGRKDTDDDEDDEDDTGHEERRCELVVELLGQRSNVILVDDNNLILDAVKRNPGTATSRTIMPREVYIVPPRPAGRLDPRTATAGGVGAALGAGGDPTKALAAMYAGVSPQLAREALARAGAAGQPSGPGADAAIAAALVALYTESPAPSLAFEGDEPVAFAPYHMMQYDEVRPVESISEALQVFFAASERLTAHAQRRDQLLAELQDARAKLERQREALERELERAQALDTLRWEGEMIYGYLHALVPGQTVLEVDGRQIKLDPAKTPSENAQARFRAYDKAKGALSGIPERMETTLAGLSYMDDMLTLLELADSFEAISTIERELTEQGVLVRREARPKGPRAGPLRLRSSEGLTILVGRSAGQNDQVTFTMARSHDLWLHARGVPGAHVVIVVEGAAGDQTVREAAGLAAYFSKARGSTTVEVSICERRHVRKVAGGPPGLVTIRNEQSVRVPPLAPDRLKRM